MLFKDNRKDDPNYNEQNDKFLRDMITNINKKYGNYYNEFICEYGDLEESNDDDALSCITSSLKDTNKLYKFNYDITSLGFKLCIPKTETTEEQYYGNYFLAKTEDIIKNKQKYIDKVRKLAEDVINNKKYLLGPDMEYKIQMDIEARKGF